MTRQTKAYMDTLVKQIHDNFNNENDEIAEVGYNAFDNLLEFLERGSMAEFHVFKNDKKELYDLKTFCFREFCENQTSEKIRVFYSKNSISIRFVYKDGEEVELIIVFLENIVDIY